MTTLMATAWLEGECRGRVPLTVLYDDRCPLCRRLRTWLAGQATVVPVEFLAAAGGEARRRFPGLDHLRTVTVLTVVAADGAVFEGERAWLMCAWALPAWQPLAEHLGGRRGLPVVRLVTRAVDGFRHRLLAQGAEESRRHSLAGSYGGGCDRCRIAAPPSPPVAGRGH